jgi:predicted permease
MSNFIIAVNAVVPMFFFIVVGLLIKYKKLMSDEEISHLNRMLFNIFFFIMLFYTTYTMDVSQTFRPRLITFGAVMLLDTLCSRFYYRLLF